MNLYRNFGNLFESWVTEGCLDLHSQPVASVDRFDCNESDSLSHVKSESEDSGLETVGLINPCHSNQEPHLTSPGIGSEEDVVQPSSPASSSSSSCVSLGSMAQRKTCLEVEQALRRTELTSRHVRRKESLHQMASRSPGPRYRCNTASFPISCHTTNSRVHHQFGCPRRTYSQPLDHRKAELHQRLLKSHQYGQPVANQLESEEEEQRRLDQLSPGLLYLEQVCRMLENIAKLQQQNNSLQKEVEILKSQHAGTECSSLNEKEINYPTRQRLEIKAHDNSTSVLNLPEEPKGFRQRSVSDTQATVRRHRRKRFAQDESVAGVLFEKTDSKDPSLEGDCKKPSTLQKLKDTSLKRTETQKLESETKSGLSKKSTKLVNIFRSRRTTSRLT